MGGRVTISIDLKPALDEHKLDERLLRDLDAHGKRKFQTLLEGLMPGKLIPVCMDLTGIPPGQEGPSDYRKRAKASEGMAQGFSPGGNRYTSHLRGHHHRGRDKYRRDRPAYNGITSCQRTLFRG